MQTVRSTAPAVAPATPAAPIEPAATTADPLTHYQIMRRNGAVVRFEPAKIAVAMMKAFLAVHGTQGAASASVRELVDELTQTVVRALMRSRPAGGTFHIEDVQDQVELALMRGSHHEVARAYVLYRERRAQERAQHKGAPAAATAAEVKRSIDVSIKAAVGPRWNGCRISGVDVDQLKTVVKFRLTQSGALAGFASVETSGQNDSNKFQVQRHQECAKRAIELAAPFDLPEENYSFWQNYTLDFIKR